MGIRRVKGAPSWLMAGLGIVSAATLVTAAGGVAFAQEDFRTRYSVGQPVSFSISGSPGDFQTCIVSENPPEDVGVMRVRCEAFRQWVAGSYIVYGARDIRPLGSASPAAERPTAARPTSLVPAATPPASRPAARPGGGDLRIGEYACYGSGGRIMIGLGFRVVSAGRYTDLEGGNAGTYSVSGGNIAFRGGHLGGQVGRNLNNGSFAIGAQAECEPF